MLLTVGVEHFSKPLATTNFLSASDANRDTMETSLSMKLYGINESAQLARVKS